MFDGEEENSLASYVEETRVLELGFCKEDVVGKENMLGDHGQMLLWRTNIGNTITSHLKKAIEKHSQMLLMKNFE